MNCNENPVSTDNSRIQQRLFRRANTLDKKTKERYSLYLCPFKESLTTIVDKKMEIDTPRLLLDLTEHGFSEKDIFNRKRELEKTDVNNTVSFSKIKQETL